MKINKLYASVLVAVSAMSLVGCGTGGDDSTFEYDPATLVSENQSNIVPPNPNLLAPDGYKVIYYVDAGDGTPSVLEINEEFGTRSSVEDQAFGTDAATGMKWGYTSATAQYYSGSDNYGSIRGDERDIAGEGIDYAFEVEDGTYTIQLAFNDPWDAEGVRHVDLKAEGTILPGDYSGKYIAEDGYYIAVDNDVLRFDNVQVTDGQLNLSIARTASNSDSEADPQISWIKILGETDEEAAAPVADVFVSGDFQFNENTLSQAPLMTPVGDGNYELIVHFQSAGGFWFENQAVDASKEAWGASDTNGTANFAADSAAITVAEAGYYTLKFNIDTLAYSVDSTDISGLAPQTEMFVIGGSFPQVPDHDWSLEDAIPMTKNFNGMGEHVYGIEGLRFSDATDVKIINERSWDGLDIGFVNAGEYNATGSDFFWGETIAGQDTPQLSYQGAAGLYTLFFDYGANRATLFKSRMYLVGAGSVGSWDVGQAVELAQGEDGTYDLALRFTNEENPDEAIKPYGDFKFVSEQTWNGGNYGLLDSAVSLTEMVNSGSSNGIPAPAPGYYNVNFDTDALQYTIEAIDLAANPVRTEMYIIGKGYVAYPDHEWNTDDAIPLTANFQDQGDYVFGYECLELSDAVEMKFIGQKGWDGLDAGFVNGGEQIAPIVWAKANTASGSADLKLIDQAGFYDVSFDYLINRINVIPRTDCN
ncbi:MAG: hypothetical protein OCD00_15620 [Colwellia sp.]